MVRIYQRRREVGGEWNVFEFSEQQTEGVPPEWSFHSFNSIWSFTILVLRSCHAGRNPSRVTLWGQCVVRSSGISNPRARAILPLLRVMEGFRKSTEDDGESLEDGSSLLHGYRLCDVVSWNQESVGFSNIAIQSLNSHKNFRKNDHFDFDF